jgi:subtilisin family serine protease
MIRKNKYKLLPYVRQDVYGLSPDDSQFSSWEISKFEITKYWKYSTGRGVKIAVIDTGCDYNHPDLKSNLLQGFNAIDGGDYIDNNGHGTHVAGTIAASNNNIGVVGVAPDAKIIPVKSMGDNGEGSLKSIVNGILWSVEQNVDIITMSIGSPRSEISLEKAIKYAASKNIAIFCAAGNMGNSHDLMYPAQYTEVISIGAIDEHLNMANFSCYGAELDFLAPGVDILSTVPKSGYARMSGTSMSNPFAVGCAALTISSVGDRLSVDNLKKLLKESSKKINNIQYASGIILPYIKK